MKKKYKVKDKGYILVSRVIQELCKEKVINFSTLGVYILFVFQADWDKRHQEYRAILPSDKQLSETWGCVESSVFRYRKKLIRRGLLEIKDGNTYVKNLDMFNIRTVQSLAKKNTAIPDLHKYYAKTEIELAKIMFEYEEMQEV